MSLPAVAVFNVYWVQLAMVFPVLPAGGVQSPNNAKARPLAVSRSVTAEPPVFTECQCSPPSSVAQSSGPNAQPYFALRNRSPVTPVAAIGPPTAGAGSPCQVRPPSSVRATDVQILEFCCAPQWPGVPAGPMIQPVVSESQVTE